MRAGRFRVAAPGREQRLEQRSGFRPVFTADRELVSRFYAAGQWQLAWVKLSLPTDQARILIDALRGAEAKGLDPLDYDGPRWTQRLARLVHPASVASESSWIDFDVALTVSAIRYVSDLQRGRLRAGPVRMDLDGEPRLIRRSQVPAAVAQALAADHALAVRAAAHPHDAGRAPGDRRLD